MIWRYGEGTVRFARIADLLAFTSIVDRTNITAAGAVDREFVYIDCLLDLTKPGLGAARRHSQAWVQKLATGCWWLLAAAGGCWRLLAAAGGCWRLLAAAGGCWQRLAAAGSGWRLLAAPFCGHGLVQILIFGDSYPHFTRRF